MTTSTAPSAPAVPDRSDFYGLLDLLEDEDRALLDRVRAFLEAEVAPVVNSMWTRERFPFDIIPRFAELGLGGLP